MINRLVLLTCLAATGCGQRPELAGGVGGAAEFLSLFPNVEVTDRGFYSVSYSDYRPLEQDGGEIIPMYAHWARAYFSPDKVPVDVFALIEVGMTADEVEGILGQPALGSRDEWASYTNRTEGIAILYGNGAIVEIHR